MLVVDNSLVLGCLREKALWTTIALAMILPWQTYVSAAPYRWGAVADGHLFEYTPPPVGAFAPLPLLRPAPSSFIPPKTPQPPPPPPSLAQKQAVRPGLAIGHS